MDFMKPLRQRRRKSALSCNVLCSFGRARLLDCVKTSARGFRVGNGNADDLCAIFGRLAPRAWSCTGCHLGHWEASMRRRSFCKWTSMKPLRQRRRKRALSCNMLFSQSGRTIVRFRRNFCAKISRDHCVLQSKREPA